MRALVAVLDRRGKDAVQKTAEMLKVLRHKGADAFGVATPEQIELKGSLEQLQTADFKSSTAVGHVFVKVLPRDKPWLTQMGDAALAFDGRIYASNSSVFKMDSMEDGLKENPEAIIRQFDGCFAFASAACERLVVGRDTLGLYPLYYGASENLFAVASERKALWKIGLEKAESFPPGHIAIADEKGFHFKPAQTLKEYGRSPSQTQWTLEEAAEKLAAILNQSFKERVHGLDEVAVAFSGGLDSSLTALLAKKAGAHVHLIHVSLQNQPETKQAEETAKILKMPFHAYLYTEGDVAEVLPEVLWTIEEPDPAKTCIGMPIFWAAEKAKELGFKILLAGQGADELFGGYKRYVDAYMRFGGETAQKMLVNDVLEMYKVNFERDGKICNFHNIELRLPFATRRLAAFSLTLPLNFKIEPSKETLRKIVLRKAAEKMGLPPQVVERRKKAIQYATGVDKALKRLAEGGRLSLNQHLQKLFQKRVLEE